MMPKLAADALPKLIKSPLSWFGGGAKTAEGCYNQAVEIYIGGRYQDALKMLEKAGRLNPGLAVIHYTKGLCYQQLNQIDEARQAFQHTLSLTPDDPDCLYNLARLHYNEDDLDVALAYAEQAGSLAQDDAVQYLLGLIYEQQGRLDEAVQAYEKTLALDPDQPFVGMYLSKLYIKQQEYEKAAALLRQLVEGDPNNLEINYELAICLAKLGEWDETIQYCKKVVSIDPSYTKAYNQLGLALYCTERLEEAVKSYEQALQIDPNYGTALNNLAYTCEKMQDFNKAIEKFTEYLSFVPDGSDEKSEIEEHINLLKRKLHD